MKKKAPKVIVKRKGQTALAEAIVGAEESTTSTRFPLKIRSYLISLMNKKNLYLGGTALVAATFIANVLNYIFNTYLVRVLQNHHNDDLALLGLFGSLYSFSTILFGAYSTTVTYKGSFLIGKYGEGAGYQYWKYILKQVRVITIAVTVLWLLLIPFLMQYFHSNNYAFFILFAGTLFLGFFTNINQGFLSARMMFGSLAIYGLTDPIVKLVAAISIVGLAIYSWSFAAIPTAILIDFIVAWILISRIPNVSTKAPKSEIEHFSKRFFLVSLLTAFSSIAYFTTDIFLAKHYLSAFDTANYFIISLVGKMVFFLGNLTAPFAIPLLSRSEGAKQNSLKTLYFLVGFTALFALVGFILFGVLGFFTVPLLYGSKAVGIVPYLPYFTFGMLCYTISSVFISYYLVRKIYTFTYVTSLLVFFQIGLISLFHNSVQEITYAMTTVLCTHFLVTLVMHFNVERVKQFEQFITKSFNKQANKSKAFMLVKTLGEK